MEKRTKLHLSIFTLVAVLSVFIFGTQTYLAYQEIDSSSVEGQVAGAYSSIVQRRVSLEIKTPESEKNLTIAIHKGEVVLDVLETAEKTGEINISLKEYDFGILLEEIDNVKSGENDMYWMYYLNGEMPMLGIDAQEVKAGDIIEFKFEKSLF